MGWRIYSSAGFSWLGSPRLAGDLQYAGLLHSLAGRRSCGFRKSLTFADVQDRNDAPISARTKSMKRCPQCNRNYADDSISFCLADGQLLSASYDAAATLPLAPARVTDGTPTQILPAALSPERARMLIRRGWIAGALGVPCGVVISLIQLSTVPGNDKPPLAGLVAVAAIGGLVYGYLFWSAWWGYPAVWRWWRGLIRKPLQFITSRLEFKGVLFLLTIIVGICLLAPALAVVFLYFYLLFLVGFAYSFFGGGIYQFLQARKIVRNSSAHRA